MVGPEHPQEREAAEQPGVRYVGDAVTTGSIPVITDDFEPAPTLPELGTGQLLRRLGVMLGLAVGVGGVIGVVWYLLVPLTVYEIQPDGRAVTNQRGLANYYASDAWFVVLGLLVGIGLGIVCWRLLNRIGWPVTLVAVISALVAGLLCWGVGWLLGPSDFGNRIAVARPGELVPIELTVRGPAALLAWMLGGIIPVLLWSSLAPDEEEPKPLRLPWRSNG